MKIIIIIIIVTIIIIYNIMYSDQKIYDIHHLSYPVNFTKKIISKDPKMYYLENIITDYEANYFIDLAEKYKTDSILARDHTKLVDIKYRTSSTAYLEKGMNKKVKIIEERIASLLNVNYKKIEPLQIVIYEKDQYFKPHLDTFYENSIELQQGGNRTHTILIYLNDIDEESGGKTIFTKLNMKFQPKKGNAIYFQNMINGKIDNRLMHEGESLYNLTKKYIINIWIREEEFWD